MTRTRVLLIGSLAWLVLGLAAGLVHLGLETTVGESALIWPAIPLYFLSSGFGSTNVHRGLLWDSAHGPPFLNGGGVLVIYFLPAALGLWRYARSRMVG